MSAFSPPAILISLHSRVKMKANSDSMFNFSCNWHFMVSNYLMIYKCRYVYQNENVAASRLVTIFGKAE